MLTGPFCFNDYEKTCVCHKCEFQPSTIANIPELWKEEIWRNMVIVTSRKRQLLRRFTGVQFVLCTMYVHFQRGLILHGDGIKWHFDNLFLIKLNCPETCGYVKGAIYFLVFECKNFETLIMVELRRASQVAQRMPNPQSIFANWIVTIRIDCATFVHRFALLF